MLRYEVEPFADAHIAKLNEAYDTLRRVDVTQTGDKIEIDRVVVHQMIADLSNACHAFVRFRVCMLDEIDQKIRMRDRYLELRNIEK